VTLKTWSSHAGLYESAFSKALALKSLSLFVVAVA